MNKGGKPKHLYWTKDHFIQKRNEKGKLVAQCKICDKILQNTAINRLKSHRKEYRYESSEFTPDSSDVDDNINESALHDHNYENMYKDHKDNNQEQIPFCIIYKIYILIQKL